MLIRLLKTQITFSLAPSAPLPRLCPSCHRPLSTAAPLPPPAPPPPRDKVPNYGFRHLLHQGPLPNRIQKYILDKT